MFNRLNIDIRTPAEVVRDEIDLELPIVHTGPRESDADISKAYELIDYEPSCNIHEGVREFIAWY